MYREEEPNKKGAGRGLGRSAPTGKDGWQAGLSANNSRNSLIFQFYWAAYVIEIAVAIVGWSFVLGSIAGKLTDGGVA